MIIEKHLEKKIKLDYFFIKGRLDINCKYFKKKLKKAVKQMTIKIIKLMLKIR